MPLFDTHAHLHDAAFDGDRAEVLTRARAAGVEVVVTVGTDLASSEAAVSLAQASAGGGPAIYATVGLHPHDARLWSAGTRERLAALARRPGVVAVGETGLDFYRNLSPRADQERAFLEQLALADALGLPVVVHSRDARAETRAILRDWAVRTVSRLGQNGAPLGVLHCFAGDAALAREYATLGFVISVAGPVTYPKSEALREVARALPLAHLVVETDAPFLAPQNRRGHRNEPAYVAETVAAVAALRGLPVEEVASACAATARRLFRLRVPELARP